MEFSLPNETVGKGFFVEVWGSAWETGGRKLFFCPVAGWEYVEGRRIGQSAIVLGLYRTLRDV
jgi:hypothetical protein